ncbi:maleylpyruvate isomerase family mycothiol-dependent enzyme [Nocardioides sp. CER19]|uniref:maleylpyruvate isomerase family mycothiol-dependent enzyme n=1 Tax=Nocardioides sp. CER19 TaxID=3038538 RepID=UPI0024481C74|nr:maleylpyruvate isomerase family mycothiol-dependent enzyme [Nocardioides sp. CER19]MDH2412617.1 maleylpyruvate isomerase family mycothiol-dependent enzyme [Nocardioides sp. CER19]
MSNELRAYIDTWWQAVGEFADLAESLADADWARPTDLPGWDVRAVVSHVAHLEGILGGAPREEAEVGPAAHVRGPMGQFTEIGVLTRRHTSPGEIVEQIRHYAAARHDALLADLPTDPSAPAPGVFGAIGWDVRRLLRNRPLDVWMHEQDVRRAVGRPGGLGSPAAEHSVTYLLESLGYVLAKRVGAAPGTTVVALVEGSPPAAYGVGADGRGQRLDTPPAEPTTTLRMSRDTFVRLAGGRGHVDPDAVTIEGDVALGEKIAASLAVTP